MNKSGSEELLYGLKSRRIGLVWVSSRITSNVSGGQRWEATGLWEGGRKCARGSVRVNRETEVQ